MLQRAVLIVGLAILAAPAAMAEQRCYFLECAPDTTPEPPPAPPVARAPLPAPPREGTQATRPRSNGEICSNRDSITYCATSVLAPQYGFSYQPGNVVDGRLDTAWVEGAPGDGIGEALILDFGAPRAVATVRVWNGYHKNIDIFRKNNRIAELDLTFSNGRHLTAPLMDRDGPQDIDVGAVGPFAWVRLGIASVYRGSKYRDTAISELRVLFAE